MNKKTLIVIAAAIIGMLIAGGVMWKLHSSKEVDTNAVEAVR